MSLPNFLRLSVAEQKSRFHAVTSRCEDHIEQARKVPTLQNKWSFKEALQPYNERRNRYVNVLPWDSTRVVLNTGADSLDYINASWVQLGPNRYIAAQGPLRNTIHHFWAMCFQQAQAQQIPEILIAMVTPLNERGIEKCAKYWPSKDDKVWDLSALVSADGLFNEMKLSWLGEELLGETLLTRIAIECNGIQKQVLHYHYKGWVDTQKPSSSEPLFALSKHISNAKQRSSKLVPIVHCSAGVGRTGTFIAIDHFLTTDVLRTGSEDPVQLTVSTMRDQRIMMVQTVSQYMFLYEVAKDLAKA